MLVIAVFGLMLGCGSPKVTQREIVGSAEVLPANERKMATGKAEILQRGPDRQIQWKAKAERSELAYRGEGKVSGMLFGVTGEIYQDGQVASRFRAAQGQADQEKNLLKLTGEVVLTSEKEGLTLTAERVSWIPQHKLVEASGSVRVTSKDYQMGRFEKLWATPDLKQVGTPDTFGNKKHAEKR